MKIIYIIIIGLCDILQIELPITFYHSYHHVLLASLIGAIQKKDFLALLASNNILVENAMFLNPNKVSAGMSWSALCVLHTGLY